MEHVWVFTDQAETSLRAPSGSIAIKEYLVEKQAGNKRQTKNAKKTTALVRSGAAAASAATSSTQEAGAAVSPARWKDTLTDSWHAAGLTRRRTPPNCRQEDHALQYNTTPCSYTAVSTTRSKQYPTQLAKLRFDEILDLTADFF